MKRQQNLDDLLNLAKQVDVSAEGSFTVLYSRMGDVLPKEMSLNSDIRILDKTDAFAFLKSDEFLKALGVKKGLRP